MIMEGDVCECSGCDDFATINIESQDEFLADVDAAKEKCGNDTCNGPMVDCSPGVEAICVSGTCALEETD